jgi:hypothetical protein
MQQKKLLGWSPKLFLFLFFFWLLGILLAFFWGLGWFFLLESLRRLVTYIPPLDRKIRELLIGKEQVERTSSYTDSVSQNMVLISKITRLIIVIVWIGITIFVFMKINIPLIDLFGYITK